MSDEMRKSYSKHSGGANPYYRCNKCGVVMPGVESYLCEHFNECHTDTPAQPNTSGVQWQCGPQANGFTQPDTHMQELAAYRRTVENQARELETLRLYKNLADEFGLSVFLSIEDVQREIVGLRAALEFIAGIPEHPAGSTVNEYHMRVKARGALAEAPYTLRIGKDAAQSTQPVQAQAGEPLHVDALAQEIRRVDGRHELGAGALAEALMPFLSAHGSKGGKP